MLQAQDLELRGSLVDQNEVPIAFATTYLYQVQDSTLVKATISDEAGNFIIKELQPGSYYLQLNSLGFAPYTSAAITLNDSMTLPQIVLEEAAEACEGEEREGGSSSSRREEGEEGEEGGGDLRG